MIFQLSNYKADLFADCVQVYKEIQHTNISNAMEMISSDLNAISLW